MEIVDCDACKHSYYQGDKLRCKLDECNPDYISDFQCSDCLNFRSCEITQGDSCEPCCNFDLSL